LRVERDLDIVCVDATNPFGNKKLLPSGILREPLNNLKRADAVVITRANLANNISQLKLEIRKYNPDCPIFISENKISKLVDLQDFPASKQSPESATNDRQGTTDKCLAFCALGNPNNFFEQLRRENYNLGATQAFPDHHFYTPKDIEKLTAKAKQNNAEILLTTAKDAVKLKNLKFDLSCYVVESKMIFDRENDFRRLLNQL
jgi:tetraacyldisaccharide 4'-kinase